MADLKMEIEAAFACPKCGGKPYILYRRQAAEGSAVFTHVLWPGSDGIPPPPADHRDLRCPNCDVALERKNA